MEEGERIGFGLTRDVFSTRRFLYCTSDVKTFKPKCRLIEKKFMLYLQQYLKLIYCEEEENNTSTTLS